MPRQAHPAASRQQASDEVAQTRGRTRHWPRSSCRRRYFRRVGLRTRLSSRLVSLLRPTHLNATHSLRVHTYIHTYLPVLLSRYLSLSLSSSSVPLTCCFDRTPTYLLTNLLTFIYVNNSSFSSLLLTFLHICARSYTFLPFLLLPVQRR